MRIRTIKPEFWTDEHLSALPESVHMLAAALLNYADDEGYFNANPALVKAACFPLREPSVSIHGGLTELSRIGFIIVRSGTDGRHYGKIPGFLKHQRINRPSPSKIKDLADFSEDSVSPHTQLTEGSLLEQGTGNREVEQGSGKEKGAAAAAVLVPVDIEVPACLKTPAFEKAWADWMAYRRERKLSAYKPTSLRTQLATLAEWGEAAAIESIRASIRQQWQGLFAPKPGTSPAKPTRSAEDQARTERILGYQPGL